MPTLVIRGPDGTLVERELVGRLTVGADEDNDLVVRTGGVEKRHANFFADGGEVVLEQLDGSSSAAQTLVDGAPVKGRKKLAPGVRVLIGGYEVQVKAGKQLTVRKLADETDEAEPPAALAKPKQPRPEAAGFPFALVFTLFGVALAVIVGLGVYKRVSSASTEVVTPPPPSTDPCDDVEPQLRVAREGYTQRALEAVEEVLKCDPIHKEANELKRRIPREQQGQALLARAKELLDLDRDAQALAQLEQLPEGTEVARTARPLLVEVATRVMKQEAKDCAAYGKKPIAEAHCKEAERLKGIVEPKVVKRDDGTRTLAERVMDRQPEPLLIEPLLLYANGKYGDAVLKLQKVRETPKLSALHAQADDLRKDITNAEALFQIGERALDKGELERAVKAFADAFVLDQKLLPEGGSQLDKTARRITAEKAYALGAIEARHENWVRACAAWKTGFGLFRGNAELNNAITRDCTGRAGALLKSGTCKDLDQALKLAVDGDTLAPQIEAQRASLRCKP